MLDKIYKLLLIGLGMALAISLSIYWKSGQKKESKPFCVTYHLVQHTISCHELLITYNDSTGLVQETFKDRHWSKKVCLPPDGIASLSANELIGVGNFLPYDLQKPAPPRGRLRDQACLHLDRT